MSLLALSNISVRYGRLTAVRGVTFTLAEGEILFITGPNGAGKSSLLRAIAGVTPPAGGRIDFADHDITGQSPEDIARLGLSMVPEGRDVFGSLTIEENLLVGTGMHAGTRGWRARAATELEAVYATFPILKGPATRPGGPSVGRPAADAGDRARADDDAAPGGDRRAIVGPGAEHHRPGL
jgi:branched-chain amino acid transport system ATP-binding protein